MNNEFNSNDLDGVMLLEDTSFLGLSKTGPNPLDNDNFYPASGDCGCGCNGDCSESQSNLLGGLIPSKKELQAARARRQNRKDIRAQSKAATRVNKSQAKVQQAVAQKTAAANLGKETSSDKALAAALAQSAPVDKKGLSMGAKIGIGVGIAAVLGISAYFILRNKGKNK